MKGTIYVVFRLLYPRFIIVQNTPKIINAANELPANEAATEPVDELTMKYRETV